jgi:predicted ATPase
MAEQTPERPAVPRIEYLRVQNYRALRDLELKNITPLTVFLGPNGSGKSAIFDVFAFLSECFTDGLRRAWDRRGRFRELRSRGQEGKIAFELKYREKPNTPVITYHLGIDEDRRGPFVAGEWLHWKRQSYGRPFRFLDFREGVGSVVTGQMPDEQDTREGERLASPEMLAANTLGQLDAGAQLGHLWMEGHFEVGDPLTASGGPRPGFVRPRAAPARG